MYGPLVPATVPVALEATLGFVRHILVVDGAPSSEGTTRRDGFDSLGRGRRSKPKRLKATRRR
jgi:hypothetical protein